MSIPKVLILIGSDSDFPIMEACINTLKDFGIQSEIRVHSAHRTPEEAKALIKSAESMDFDLIIAAAGLAAHLPGVCAAFTTLPVIGVPIDNGALQGVDALYSIVQMPPGVPVGCMGIGKIGAKNAAIYTAQILSLKYRQLKEKLTQFKEDQRKQVLEKDAKLQEKLS